MVGEVALRDAYDSSDINKFLSVLSTGQAIASDPFMEKNVGPLLREIRGKAMLHFIKPYRRVFLADLGQRLKISKDEVKSGFSFPSVFR